MYDLRGRMTVTPSRVEVLPTAFAGMGMALGLTGAVSWWASHNIPGIGQWLWPLIILQFGLILAIGTVRAWAQEADNLSLGLLFVYAGVTGLVLAPVSSLYLATVAGQGLVIKALGSATVTFGAAAAYGWITKRDLSSWGGILTMGVLGLILSSLLNVFWLQSSMTDLVLSGISVLIFTAFTAYDLNMAKENRYNATAGQIALGLYLNFLNLFLAMLRLFSGGDRR